MSVDINKIKKEFLRISYGRYESGTPDYIVYGLFKFHFQYLIIRFNDLDINPHAMKKGDVRYTYDTIENKWILDESHRVLVIDRDLELIQKFDHDDYNRINKQREDLFKDINEEVGSNFGDAKKEFIDLVIDKFKNVDTDIDIDGMDSEVGYELYRKEGLYIILVIGSFIGEEYYQKNGYIYGRTGWKFNHDMENIIEHRDQLELVIKFGYGDYMDIMDNQSKLFNDINEEIKFELPDGFELPDPKKMEKEIREVKKNFIDFVFNQYKEEQYNNNEELVYELRHMGVFGRDVYVCHIIQADKYIDIGYSYDLGNEEWNVTKNLIGMERQGKFIIKVSYDDYLKVNNQRDKLMNDINEGFITDFKKFKKLFNDDGRKRS